MTIRSRESENAEVHDVSGHPASIIPEGDRTIAVGRATGVRLRVNERRASGADGNRVDPCWGKPAPGRSARFRFGGMESPAVEALTDSGEGACAARYRYALA